MITFLIHRSQPQRALAGNALDHVIEKQDRAGLGISKFLDDLDAALPQLLELLEFFDFFLESLQSLVLCLEGVARSGETSGFTVTAAFLMCAV